MTNISVFGLGYVGTISAAFLANKGHAVIGVDVNPTKVELFHKGHSPVIEEGIAELMRKGVDEGRISATVDTRYAVMNSSISLICVGTPSRTNGSLDLDHVERVCKDIGLVLAEKVDYHIVVLRSTVLPGTSEDVLLPILEQSSGKKAFRDFGLCFNPEFLREGIAVKDFADPPFTVIGSDDERTSRAVAELYSMLTAPVMVVPIKVAEMVKYANNAFHALKVTFANEIGNLCKQQGIDSHLVMDIFSQDTKMNLSPYYLKPGFAFGGSCLPKDLRALIYHSHRYDLNLCVLNAVLESNRRQVEIAYEMVKATGYKNIGVLGISFKAGTDDLRASPVVDLIEHLIGKGYQINIYDKNVSLANLYGANRAYIEQEIPHIAQLMQDTILDVLKSSQVIIIGNDAPEFKTILSQVREDQIVIDLVRGVEGAITSNGHYQGICW
jgi:GDP-mannose 6-dehydrogenase